MPGQKKTITKSFRMDSRIIAQVESDADELGISLNSMINRILQEYVEYDRFFSTMPVVTILHDSVKYMLETISQEDAISIGERTARNLVVPVIFSRYGKITKETIMDYLKLINLGRKLYTLNIRENQGSTRIILIHQLGTNGTNFYIGYIKCLLQEAGCEPAILTTENSLTISV